MGSLFSNKKCVPGASETQATKEHEFSTLPGQPPQKTPTGPLLKPLLSFLVASFIIVNIFVYAGPYSDWSGYHRAISGFSTVENCWTYQGAGIHGAGTHGGPGANAALTKSRESFVLLNKALQEPPFPASARYQSPLPTDLPTLLADRSPVEPNPFRAEKAALLQGVVRGLHQLVYDVVSLLGEKDIPFSMLTGGSTLGAVRNKGILPWDEDLDLMVPVVTGGSIIRPQHPLVRRRKWVLRFYARVQGRVSFQEVVGDVLVFFGFVSCHSAVCWNTCHSVQKYKRREKTCQAEINAESATWC